MNHSQKVPIIKGPASQPVLSGDAFKSGPKEPVALIDGTRSVSREALRVGLGIDAGGTYTDAAIYDFATETVLSKAKALTTSWDFTIGIGQPLAGLNAAQLAAVELVSVSTTLATNALIENEGQKVGLLIMPPAGFEASGETIHCPQQVLSARLDISGKGIAALDEDQVRRVSRFLCDQMDVEAFAVSGYAGSINPEHELRTKQIVEQETGRFVSCGHELYQMLNFKLRAATAVHNARIVPRLVRLLAGICEVLSKLEIHAPVMVVRGDGTLMTQALAQERPVETILSGPAASIAGAGYLTKIQSAVVVDMGGTTTDIAALEKGSVKLSQQGSRVGSARTHVKALDIQTTGLGDEIFLERTLSAHLEGRPDPAQKPDGGDY